MRYIPESPGPEPPEPDPIGSPIEEGAWPRQTRGGRFRAYSAAPAIRPAKRVPRRAGSGQARTGRVRCTCPRTSRGPARRRIRLARLAGEGSKQPEKLAPLGLLVR